MHEVLVEVSVEATQDNYSQLEPISGLRVLTRFGVLELFL